MTRPIQTLRQAYAAHGYLAPATVAEAKVLAADLLRHPAYLDNKHPDHAAIVEDVRMFYEATVPEVE
jgi:hypothetical protein